MVLPPMTLAAFVLPLMVGFCLSGLSITRLTSSSLILWRRILFLACLLILKSIAWAVVVYVQDVGLYCSAWDKCEASMVSTPARSAIVLATFRTR